MKKFYIIENEIGEKWKIPTMLIATDRAKYYAEKDDVTIKESLEKDTIPLFKTDEYEIEDWAKNNMNWSDVEKHAIKISEGQNDMQEIWMNGNVSYSD